MGSRGQSRKALPSPRRSHHSGAQGGGPHHSASLREPSASTAAARSRSRTCGRWLGSRGSCAGWCLLSCFAAATQDERFKLDPFNRFARGFRASLSLGLPLSLSLPKCSSRSTLPILSACLGRRVPHAPSRSRLVVQCTESPIGPSASFVWTVTGKGMD